MGLKLTLEKGVGNMKFGKKKIFYLVVGAVIVAFILGGVYYYFGSKKSIISEGDTIDYQVDVTVTGYGAISCDNL